MKRMFWTGVGYTVGAGTSWYVQRRVRRTVNRFAPDKVRGGVAAGGRTALNKAKDLAGEVRAAAEEGLATWREEKADLMAEFGGGEPEQRIATERSSTRRVPHHPRQRPSHSTRT